MELAPILSGLLDEPIGVHLDPWDVIILATALLLAIAAANTRRSVARRWAHHPFRVAVQGHMANALLGTAIAVALVGVSHLLGWPIYGLPGVGVVALILSALLIIWLPVDWRRWVKPELARYEEQYPGVANANAPLLPRARRSESNAPLLWAIGSGFIAYAAFVWHPWPHLFHEGNFVFGAPVGYAIGSLVAMHTATISRPSEAPKRVGSHRSARRRR